MSTNRPHGDEENVRNQNSGHEFANVRSGPLRACPTADRSEDRLACSALAVKQKPAAVKRSPHHQAFITTLEQSYTAADDLPSTALFHSRQSLFLILETQLSIGAQTLPLNLTSSALSFSCNQPFLSSGFDLHLTSLDLYLHHPTVIFGSEL